MIELKVTVTFATLAPHCAQCSAGEHPRNAVKGTK